MQHFVKGLVSQMQGGVRKQDHMQILKRGKSGRLGEGEGANTQVRRRHILWRASWGGGGERVEPKKFKLRGTERLSGCAGHAVC